jgi:hypothetical protein
LARLAWRYRVVQGGIQPQTCDHGHGLHQPLTDRQQLEGGITAVGDDVTVRLPGVKMAPTSKILAHSHTRSLNIGSNCRNTCIMAGGRLRMAPPFLVDRFESSVACFLFLVYQMDKAELSIGVAMNPCLYG